MNQSITVNEAGEYWINAQSGNCVLSDTIEVTGGDFSLFIPNAFTPDNDGLNDVFKPVCEGITNYDLMIFTRWGEMIFESADKNSGWDGKYKDALAQLSIYVYVLQYGTICSGEMEFRKYGIVTLVR